MAISILNYECALRHTSRWNISNSLFIWIIPQQHAIYVSQFNPNWTHSTRIGTFRKWILYASNVTNTKCQCLIARHQDVRIFRKIHSLTIGLECYVVCIPFVSPNIFVRLLSFVAVGNFHVKICIQRNNSTKQIAANLSMYFRWYVLRSIGMYSVNLRNCNSSLYIKTLSLFCLTLRTFKTLMKMSEKHVEGIVSNSNVDGQELSFCFVNLFYSLEKPFFFFLYCRHFCFYFVLFSLRWQTGANQTNRDKCKWIDQKPNTFDKQVAHETSYLFCNQSN